MQTISNALRNAINAGNPQRVLLVFSESELSNENISVSRGITLREDFNSEKEITIGTCPSATISFDLLNDEGQLQGFEFGWFTAYLGARIDIGTPTEITRQFTENGSQKTYAFCPIGTFYADKPSVINKKIISVTAYDQMLILEKDMASAADLGLTYPTTIGTIFEKICDFLQIDYVSSEFLNYDLEVQSEPEELSNAKFREVIAWIAECACSVARFNRNGRLEFVWFNDTEVEYDESNYSEFSQAWYSTKKINGLYVRDTNEGTQTAQGAGQTNNYLILDNPFLKGG